jgi:hypothetical protein
MSNRLGREPHRELRRATKLVLFGLAVGLSVAIGAGVGAFVGPIHVGSSDAGMSHDGH